MGAIPQGGSDYATQVSIGSPGGVLVHGNATVGLTAVLVRAANARTRSRVFVNKGPGEVHPGGAAVTTANTVPVPVGGSLVLDRSNGDLYFIATQAGTDLRFVEEQN